MNIHSGRGKRRNRDGIWDADSEEEPDHSVSHLNNTEVIKDCPDISDEKRAHLIHDNRWANDKSSGPPQGDSIHKSPNMNSTDPQFHSEQLNYDSRAQKHAKLFAKSEYHDSERRRPQEYQPYRKKENGWEASQLRKATEISSTNTDMIVLPDLDQYEYVFDESQFVDFDEDETLRGDDIEDTIPAQEFDSVRKSLPVYRYRQQFLDAVQEHQVLIVVGETGSGKTTQLPQYLHEAGYTLGPNGNKLMVGCTQPRRVAATSVAGRVAQEMGVDIGHEVGYTIRFEDCCGPETVVKYLTDGMLLREFLTDPELSRYGAIMIDEAHERTLSTEILLSLLKDIAQTRPELRLVIASATINAQKFSSFFGNAPILTVPGRRFPVDVHYTKSPEANYIQAAITTIFQIHLTQDLPGDILVFLTGQEEIETMEESLRDLVLKLGDQIKPLSVCSIYANLPLDMQRRIFEPAPRETRKVVLATNIAETSITIDGISYVIDPGFVKQNAYNASTGMDSLVVVSCSRASADQRAGRAGRLGPGKCYRLYTKWSFYNELEANPVPEILRVNLVLVVLLLLSLGITDLVGFDFMDPPSPGAIIKALELLYSLGALNARGELTKTGHRMSEFPIDPMFSRTLLQSSKYGVFDQVLTIIAVLGESNSLFYRPKDKREQADSARQKFVSPFGDHLMLLDIYLQWQDSGYSSQWCQDHFIQYKTLKRARQVRQQLERQCRKVGIEKLDGLGMERDDIAAMIVKALVLGFFPQLARLSRLGDSYQRLKQNVPVYMHPLLCLSSTKPFPKLVLYHQLVLTSKEYMRNCIQVDEKWVSELASHYYSTKDLEFIRPKK